MCKPDKRGHCSTHDCMGKFEYVSNKKWKFRGNARGYGYVYGKSRKFICKMRNSAPTAPDISTSRHVGDMPVGYSDVFGGTSMKGKTSTLD